MTVTDHDVPQLPAPDTTTPAPAASRPGGGRTLIWLLWLLTLGALAGLAFYGWQQLQAQQSALASLRTDLQQQAAQLQSLPAQLESGVEQQLQRHRDELDNRQRELTQRLDALAARVLAMSNTDREDWKLAEAEHLLRMANQRVLLERSGANALALAQQVDDILRGLNQSGLQETRRALAAEMAELRLAGDIDREGVFLRLLALGQHIERLPMIEPLNEEDESWSLAADDVDQGLWARAKRGINQVLRRFSQHLRIRDHGADAPALLPPDNRLYLKQNLRLMLEQAQAALLREEAQIYQASLTKAQEWLKTYYPLSDEAIALQAELAELLDVTFTRNLPGLDESAALLRAYVERRHARALGAGNAEAGEAL